MFHSAPEYLLRVGIKSQLSAQVAAAAGERTWRAAVCTEIGKPLEIQLIESNQALEFGQVRVALKFAGINFAEILAARGKYQERQPVPFIPGFEGSGEVIEVGPGVTKCSLGDHVAVSVMGAGRTSLSSGAYCEHIVVNSEGITRFPPSFGFAELAAFQGSYITAYLALKHQAKVQPGETVVVTAAAGATGLAFIDVAKNICGAKVIGVAGGADKCRLLMERGATAAVDYSKDDLKIKVMALTDKRGADVVVDMVGGSTMDQCVKCVTFGGRLLVVGFASGDLPKIAANQLLLRSASAMGVWWGGVANTMPDLAAQLLHELHQLMLLRKISPHIGQTFPLAKVNEAFDYIMNRESVGKVLLDLSQ